MGLYKINRRPKDIADIKPRSDNNAFCQPIYKHTYSSSSESKQCTGNFPQLSMTKKLTLATQATIADRRNQKLESKAKSAVKQICPQQI